MLPLLSVGVCRALIGGPGDTVPKVCIVLYRADSAGTKGKVYATRLLVATTSINVTITTSQTRTSISAKVGENKALVLLEQCLA